MFLNECPDEVFKQICIFADHDTMLILLSMRKYGNYFIENIYDQKVFNEYYKFYSIKNKLDLNWEKFYNLLISFNEFYSENERTITNFIRFQSKGVYYCILTYQSYFYVSTKYNWLTEKEIISIFEN